MTDEQIKAAFDEWRKSNYKWFAAADGEFSQAFAAGATFGATQQRERDIATARGKLIGSPEDELDLIHQIAVQQVIDALGKGDA